MTIRRGSTLNTVAVPLVGLAATIAGCDPAPSPPSPPAAHSGSNSATQSSARSDTSPTPARSNQVAPPAAPVNTVSQPEKSAAPTSPLIATDDLPPLPEPRYEAVPESLRSKFAEARAKVDAAPRGSLAVCELGALYYNSGAMPQAIACFRRAVALAPESAPPHYLLAIALAQSGERESAIHELGDVIKADSNYMPARIRQADLIYETDKAKAVDAYRRAIVFEPKAPFLHFRLGQCLRALGDSENAEREFLTAVELQADYGDAHAALAEYYAAANKPDAASKHRNLAAGGKPGRGFPDPLFTGMLEVGRGPAFASSRAVSLAAKSQFIEAIRLLKDAQAYDPRDLQCIATLASIYEAIGNHHAAADSWAQVNASDAKWPNAAIRLANAYAKTDQLPRAISTLRSHLDKAPDDAAARYWLARFLAQNDERNAALEEVTRFLKDRGETADSLCQFAHVLIEAGKLDDAARTLDQAQSRDGAFADVHYFRALLHARSGDSERADAEFDQLLVKKPGGLDGYVEAASHAAEQRNWERTVRILKSGMQQKPNAPILKSMLADLLATCPDASIRNGNEAVQLAEELCLSTGMTYHAYLDILAKACAETGDFDRAARLINEAISGASAERQTETVVEYVARMKLYKSREPYHQK